MTSIDIFWTNKSDFTTVQNVDTIQAAIDKFNENRIGAPMTMADVERYETIPDGQITQFGMMFHD